MTSTVLGTRKAVEMQANSPDMAPPPKKPRLDGRFNNKRRRLIKSQMQIMRNPGHVRTVHQADGKARVIVAQSRQSSYAQTWLAPVMKVKWAYLNVGGDVGEKKKYLEGQTPDGLVPKNKAKLSCVALLGGLTDSVHEEQRTFVAEMLRVFDRVFPVMWNNTPQQQKYLDKAKRLLKKKSLDDQKAKAFQLFVQDVRLPFKDADATQFAISAPAFRRDETESVPIFFNRHNRVIEPCPDILDGAILELGLSLNVYELPTGATGINFRWDIRNNVFWKNGSGHNLPSEASIHWPKANPVFVNKDGRVFANRRVPGSGNRCFIRTAALRFKYPPASTEGRVMNGKVIEAKEAKYTAMAEENDSDTVRDFLDHMEHINSECLTFMFDNPDILVDQTSAQLREAELALSESDAGVVDIAAESRALALENFMAEAKTPITCDEHTDTRRIKFTSGWVLSNAGTMNFKVQNRAGDPCDSDTGTPYELDDFVSNDTLSVVIVVSPWVAPSGDSYGVSYKLTHLYPIVIHERAISSEEANDLSGGRDMSFLEDSDLPVAGEGI